ncbi:WSSV266 [White spot syndrome virus]|uniref:WSSV266 n=1 Tax=White spot syndrome virus TaxID=342409 RepID=A0A2I6SBZ4_9VIRU|nr:WSSV266 [White spot syndrome virus]
MTAVERGLEHVNHIKRVPFPHATVDGRNYLVRILTKN